MLGRVIEGVSRDCGDDAWLCIGEDGGESSNGRGGGGALGDVAMRGGNDAVSIAAGRGDDVAHGGAVKDGCAGGDGGGGAGGGAGDGAGDGAGGGGRGGGSALGDVATRGGSGVVTIEAGRGGDVAHGGAVNDGCAGGDGGGVVGGGAGDGAGGGASGGAGCPMDFFFLRFAGKGSTTGATPVSLALLRVNIPIK